MTSASAGGNVLPRRRAMEERDNPRAGGKSGGECAKSFICACLMDLNSGGKARQGKGGKSGIWTRKGISGGIAEYP